MPVIYHMIDDGYCFKKPMGVLEGSHKSWPRGDISNIFASLISAHQSSRKMVMEQPIQRITGGGIAFSAQCLESNFSLGLDPEVE